MSFGHRALNRAQISNAENTVGTAEAATAIVLYETLTQLSNDKVFHRPKQDRGSLAEFIEVPFQVSQFAELEMAGDLYDQLMVYIASNSIRGNVTGVSAGGLTPNEIVWTFEPTLTAPNTPDQTNGIDTFTLEWGNNIQEYESSYMVSTEFVIEGAASNEEDAAVTFTWNFFVRGVSESTFTGALTAPTTHQFFAVNKAKWFVDTTYAGIGGTQKSGVLKGFKYTYETMFTPRFSADGNLYFSGVNEDRKSPTLEQTLWRDSTIWEAELDKFLAQSMSYQRVALYGNTEMDSGQSNPPYVYLDGAWRYTEWPELDEEDGNELVTVTARAQLDSTSSKMCGVKIGTLMTAFP